MKRSYTILYVDDDLDDLQLISDAFEKYTDHLAVIHANNGREGLQVLQKMNEKSSLPCLIILDINMPIMDGKQMLKRLRQEDAYKDVPVILFSTSNSFKDRIFAEGLDAEFVPKPHGYTELKSLVAQFVNKCRYEVKKTA